MSPHSETLYSIWQASSNPLYTPSKIHLQSCYHSPQRETALIIKGKRQQQFPKKPLGNRPLLFVVIKTNYALQAWNDVDFKMSSLGTHKLASVNSSPLSYKGQSKGHTALNKACSLGSRGLYIWKTIMLFWKWGVLGALINELEQSLCGGAWMPRVSLYTASLSACPTPQQGECQGQNHKVNWIFESKIVIIIEEKILAISTLKQTPHGT